MNRQYSRLAVFALVLSMSSFSCAPKLAVIPPEDIPAAFREFARVWPPGVMDVTWRACYEQDDYVIAVYTAMGTGGPMKTPTDIVWLVHRGSADPRAFPLGTNNWKGGTYSWKAGSHGDGHGRYNIYACGSALTKAAYKVVGTTSQGRIIEARVVNGFWCLLMPNHLGAELFEKVVLQDEQGRVLYTY